MKLKAKWLVLVLMLTMVFTACGKSTTNDKDATPSTEATVTEQPMVTEEPEVTQELKVVSFSPSITEIIYALDAKDMLVGRTDYCDYPVEALATESIGDFYSPDVEKIVGLEPDMVLTSALWTEDVAQKFKEAGIEVVVINEASKVDDVYHLITKLGELLHKEEKAAEIVDGMKKDLEELTAKVSLLDKTSVYYVLDYGEYGEYTATGDTYISQMLELAGGENIAKDATGWTYTLESLIENDPEVIIINEERLDDFMAQENYKNLSAVKNNKVYGIDDDLLTRQTNRTIEGIRTIAKMLHPEAFEQ